MPVARPVLHPLVARPTNLRHQQPGCEMEVSWSGLCSLSTVLRCQARGSSRRDRL